MTEIVERALEQWGLEGANSRLVAARENAVYEVTQGDTRVALRLHRQGYRSDLELRSELAWMDEVAKGGLNVAAPIPAQNGALLLEIDGAQIDVLTWLTGRTMTETLGVTDPKDHAPSFYALGCEMARLHQISDAWTTPPDFERVHWDVDGLLGDAPVWDRFWANPELTKADRDRFKAFRHEASARLVQIGRSLDYGLVHADLVPDNVLIDGNTLRLLDFDDGGFGYRLFDVATALLKHMSAPNYPHLQSSLIDGYHSIRPLDIAELDLFLALRAATYVGWNITRISERNGAERNKRFIDTLRGLATRNL